MLYWIGAVSGQQIAPASRYLVGRDYQPPREIIWERGCGVGSVLKESGRLLVVTESLGIGGTETHLIRLLPELASAGWQITTFCLTARGKRASQLEAAGIRVFAPPLRDQSRGAVFRSPTRTAERFASLYRLARNWRPAIAHFYLPGPYLVGAPAVIAARVPIKVMSRRSSANYQNGRPIAASLERMLHKKMDMVIGNSGAVVRELRAERVSEAKLHLIYNGIDVSADRPDRRAARRALGLGADDLVGVMVANLIHYKGHCDLIHGLINVAKQLPLEWHILIAGRDEGIRHQLHSLAIGGGIRPHIKFLGECPDTTTLLAAADFGLLTSHEEGFSNAILEGMAAGLPMIVTDVGGNPEQVIDGITGLVVPSRNPEAIGEAILRLAGDASLRVRLGEAGRTRAQAEFSIERCVSAHDKLYRSLLDTFVSQKGLGVDPDRWAARRPSHS